MHERPEKPACVYFKGISQEKQVRINDEYLYCIPNPKHMLKYTKVKVLGTQDKYI